MYDVFVQPLQHVVDNKTARYVLLFLAGRVEIFDGMAFLLHTVSEDRIPELVWLYDRV